ncbi:MAG: hypothetical protein HY554_07165 [Elusimicrobia bacterium]|nr:hypothetical protein [Elusimicrobiota bacterium]
MNATAFLLLPAQLLAAAAFSQTVETEGARPGREAATRIEAAATAGESSRAESAESDAPVSYEDVLRAPDDVELNYRWARAQVQRGDLKGASATLRRILLVDPSQAKTRLFHAIVLFRLDDLSEAKEEFLELQNLELDAEVRAQVAEFLREIELRQKKTRLQGVLGLGFQRDDNRNYSPSSGQRLFRDTPIPLAGDALAQADESLVSIGSLQLARDLGAQSGHEARSSLTYYRSDQRTVSTLDLQAVSWRGGVQVNGRAGQVTPVLQFDHVQLGRGTFLRAFGAGAKAERKLLPRVQLFGAAVGQYQGYGRTRDVPTADERSGGQWDLTLGSDLAVTPRAKGQVGYTHTIKNAARRYNAFARDSLFAQHLWFPGRGLFVASGVTLGFDRYEAADETISLTRRSDANWRLSATLGAPLAVVSPALRQLVWTLGFEHYRSDSNVLSYSYRNNQVSTSLAYRWDAGL